jgi:hypothetical protein
VVSLASGGQIFQVAAPAGVSYFGVAAAGDGHTFLLAATAGRTGNIVQFYEVRVGPGGQSGNPVLVLSVPEKSLLKPTMTGPVSFAISPDASMLAYSTVAGFEVVSLATGQATSWSTTGSPLTQLFSWAGDDHTLAFYWSSKSDQAQSGVRLLDTRAKGPLLQVSRLIIPNSVVFNADNILMTADASKIFIGVYSGSGSGQYGPTRGVVEEFSTRTGRVLTAVTPKVHAEGVNCQVLWTDASGSQVVSFCASSGAADGTGMFVDDNGHVAPTSLEAPVNSLNSFGSNSPALSSSLFGW